MNPLNNELLIELRNILKSAGLDDKETKVYLALLTVKSATVNDLCQAAGLRRSTVYFILDRLREKGFVSMLDHGKIRHFVAEPPERIVAHIQDTQLRFHRIEQQLNNVMPLLRSLMNPIATTPNVTLLHGVKGLKQLYKTILPGDFIGFLNPKVMYESFGMTTAEMLFGKKLPLKGRDLIVAGDYTQRYADDHPPSPDYAYRVLPQGIEFLCDVMISENNVAIFTYDHQHTVIHIQNDRTADMMRSWFEALWAISTDA